MTSNNFEIVTSPSAKVAESVKIVADSGAAISIGQNAEVRDYTVLESIGGGKIEIGDRSIVGYSGWVHGSGGVTIGNDVMIGPSVAITSSAHRYALDVPMYQQGLRYAPVVIEDDVWIGANATVAAGSHIGKGAIVAANSVVKGRVPPNVIVAGNPARVVSTRAVRTVLFYTLPLVIRSDALLFRHILERYVRLAKSYEALGWRCVFAGTDELAEMQRQSQEGTQWRSPASFGMSYRQGDDWMSVWNAILAGQPVPQHEEYLGKLLDDVKPDIVYCWNFDALLRSACEARGKVVLFNELGLSREPNPVVYYNDPVGVNSSASMREFWQRYQAADSEGRIKADGALRADSIVPNYAVSDVRRRELLRRLAPRKGNYALILMQVSDDSNIVAGSRFSSMQAYVDYCVSEIGDQIDIVVKPHPAEAFEFNGLGDGVVMASVDDVTTELIGAASAVVTINSSAGFEAAMAGKAVYVLGRAPYSGLGVTIDLPEGGLRDAWRVQEGRAPASDAELDRVADFAFHHYFLSDTAFFEAGEHLSRIADWQRTAIALGKPHPYLADIEMDRYLAQIRDLQSKCAVYEEWNTILQGTAKDVEKVSAWAQNMDVERKAALAEVEHYRKQLERLNAKYVPYEKLGDTIKQTAENVKKVSAWAEGARFDFEAEHAAVDAAQAKVAEVYASHSWKVTSPLRMLSRMTRLSAPAQLRTVQAAIKRRGGMGAFSRQALEYYRRNGARGVVARLRRRVAHSVAPAPRLVMVPELLPKLPPVVVSDVIVFGVIDWNFRFQRPQQLSLGFAKRGHRVFYVSSELIASSEPGFSVEPIANQNGVYQIRFHVKGVNSIYGAPPNEGVRQQLLQGLGMLVTWLQAPEFINIVHHPFWLPLARAVPRSHFVYDCMDHHEGFGHAQPEIIAAERALMAESDALIVTSSWLYDIAKGRNASTSIVRNACDFAHFSVAPENVYRDAQGRKVIGYYGAIAEWFDIELVGRVAEAFPDHLVLLVGADTCDARGKLKQYRNVEFTGEVPYKDLPFYLYGFDICLLPFLVIDLTLATNPVKVYEYLCSGKTVVSVKLPELEQFGDLVLTADTHERFVDQCRVALSGADASVTQRRIEFASQQTWEHRAREFETALEVSTRPLVSVIVVTYNNLDLTKKCLASVEKHTTGVDYEIIIVDNASQDGSPDFLREYAATRPFVRLQLNADNLGFSAANNQGLAMGKGDYLVVLNNDTVVTAGWALGLIRHLRRDSSIGLIGPVTNNIGNEAKIAIEYPDLDAMPAEAAKHTSAHLGHAFDINTLAFFCVMLPRTTYTRVGGLDEAFGLGFFEDDDYCRRVQQQGLKCVCADDVFVHHNLSASFNKLGEERKRKLMETNRKIYEAKWGPWVPHQYRAQKDVNREQHG